MRLNNTKNNIALISTRPYDKNIVLLKELEDTNISLLNYPLTQIKSLNDYSKFDLILKNLKNYQHIIFISTNAVNFFIERITKLSLKLPGNLIFSSIGPATQKALQDKFNIYVHCPESNYDSEHLIQNKIFNNIEKQNILIIRGVGGREALKTILKKKGAKVAYGECYIRNYLKINLNQLKNDIKIFDQIYLLITSYESAKHFLNQNKKQNWDWLQSLKIIVNHQRIKKELSLISNKIIVTNDINGKLINLISKNSVSSSL
jgi:uroporphyrinogen-III synthase